jgi:hypothetical protein
MKMKKLFNEDSSPDSNFDWRKIVAENTPGTASPQQMVRQELLAKLETALSAWTAKHEISQERVGQVAYYAATVCPVDTPYEQVQLLAQYILWLFWFDKYDLLDLSDPSAKSHLEHEFHTLTEVLCINSGLSIEKPTSFGLFAHPIGDSRFCETSKLGMDLSQTLIEILDNLMQIWERLFPDEPEANRVFRLSNCMEWLAATLAAAKQEILKSFDYIHNKNLPSGSLDDYLKETGEISISLPATLAFLNSFDMSPEAIWLCAFPAILESSRIIRLANDLGNYWNELKELKFNSITMALLQLGFEPFGDYTESSLEIIQATVVVKQRLQIAINDFVTHFRDVPEGMVSHFLWHGTALALAMYEPGDFVIPNSIGSV